MLVLGALIACGAGAAAYAATCGDGVLDAGEECDDANVADGDGCDGNCTVTACGNGVVTAGEACDDGNTHGCDGCDSGCQEEPAGASWCFLGGPSGGAITRVAVDPQDADVLYAATLGGVLKTVNGAASWLAAEEGIRGSGVSGIAVSPADSSVVIAGRATESFDFSVFRARGIYRSVDGGADWTLVQQVDPDPFGFGFGVGDVAFHPADSSVAYATAGSGFYRSMDGGVTWSRLSTMPSCRLAVASDGTLLAAAVDFIHAGHIARSTDDGATWTVVLDGLMACPQRISVAASDPSRAFATTASGVYRSTDGGASWSLVYPPTPAPPFAYSANAVAIHPTDPDVVYAHIAGGCQACALPEPELLVSADGGDSWASTGFGASGVSDLAFTTGPTGALFAGTGLGVFRSEDGVSWAQRNVGLLAADIFVIAQDPSIAGRLYVGTGGIGVWRSVDGGATWTVLNQNEVRFVRALVVHPTNPDVLVAGVYGGGIYRSDDGGGAWVPRNIGLAAPEGYDVRGVRGLAIDPQQPATMYAALDEGLFRSADGADSWSYVDVGTPISASAVAIGPAGEVYVGTTGGGAVYRSLDGGATWSSAALAGQVDDLVVDASDPVRVYAATSNGFASSTDAGLSWSGLSGPSGLTALAIDPENPATLYATAPSAGVYRSVDRGGAWELVATSGLTNARVWDVTVVGGGAMSLAARSLAVASTTGGSVLVVSRDTGGASGVFRAATGGTGATSTTVQATTTTSTTAPPEGALPLAAAKLVLRNGPDASRRSAVVLSRDATLGLGGGAGSADDPATTAGSSLRIRTGDGCAGPCDTTYALDRALWGYAGATVPSGYRYKNPAGPIRAVRLKRGKLKIAARGPMGHALGADPAPVDVYVSIAARTFCMRFGGTTTLRAGRTFVASDAPAPADCGP